MPNNDFRLSLEAALNIADFDTAAAHSKMSMRGRQGIRLDSMQGKPRQAGVLCLLFIEDNGLHVTLTKRPNSLRDHSGQISFPGGKMHASESMSDAALRETFEEIGIHADEITLIGNLKKIYVPPTDYEVFPFVGLMNIRPKFQPNPDEVESILTPSLTHLLDEMTCKSNQRTFPQFNNATIDVPYFDVDGHQVWGATAIMLSELLERWRMLDMVEQEQ